MKKALYYAGAAVGAAVAAKALARDRTAHTAVAASDPLPNDEDLQIVQSQVIVRHGWRAPLSISKRFGEEASETANLGWVRLARKLNAALAS